MASDPASPIDAPRNEPVELSLSDEENYANALVNEGIPKSFAAQYASELVRHCIGLRSRVNLDAAHLAEMGVRIGHREDLLVAVRKLRAQLNEPQGSFVASPSIAYHEIGPDERKPDGDEPYMIKDVAVPAAGDVKTVLRCHRWRFDSGLVWDDWNGWMPGDDHIGRDAFTACMTDQLRRFDISNVRSFLRLFADNKPMPFLVNEGLVSGLLLRLPSPDFLVTGDEQIEVSSVSTTVHELMNRLVVLIGVDKEGRPTVFTYRKDRQVAWMGYFSREWTRLRNMSGESIVNRLLRESIESFRPVLQTLSRQLDLISSLPDSYRPVYVVKAFSRIQRQASVLARSLAGNVKVATELRDSNSLLGDLSAAINVGDTMHTLAEEIRENAQEMMGLRLTMMDFKSQMNMRLFTYFSVIAAPIGVITGWFGMNFDQMDELHIDGFYYGVVGFVLGFILLIVLFLMWANRDRSVTRETDRLAALVLMEDAMDATD